MAETKVRGSQIQSGSIDGEQVKAKGIPVGDLDGTGQTQDYVLVVQADESIAAQERVAKAETMDDGGGNTATAANVKDAVDKKHAQLHVSSHYNGGSDELSLDKMEADADVEFNQNQALQFVLENRTSDPGSPVNGQMWFRTNL